MPLFLQRIFRLLRGHLDQLSWQILAGVSVAHMALTWLLLSLAGEHALTGWTTFFYYYVVTTSTVGYGDFSPTTDLGRLLVAVVQIPFGLALFGVLLGKAGQTFTYIIRLAMTGEKDLSHLSDQIVIFGWHPQRTKKMIDYILADSKRVKRHIVLAVTDEMEHPFFSKPDVSFVRLASYTDEVELARVGIRGAAKVIVDGVDDNQTFTTALKVSHSVSPECHVCAWFDDETKAEMLNQHCKNIECSSSKTAEMLVRSMEDPGSSRVQEEIMSSLHGDTQFSMRIPEHVGEFTFGDIFQPFKTRHNATILGIAHNISGLDMDLNPPLDYPVRGGDIIHYIAPERVLADEVTWPTKG